MIYPHRYSLLVDLARYGDIDRFVKLLGYGDWRTIYDYIRKKLAAGYIR